MSYIHTIPCKPHTCSTINQYLTRFASCEEWEVHQLANGETTLFTDSRIDASYIKKWWGA